jgi:hypothetical protein
MLNNFAPIFGFIFIFSIMALLKLIFDFVRAIFSDPPKPFEINKWETLTYGLFVSYIITYLIY